MFYLKDFLLVNLPKLLYLDISLNLYHSLFISHAPIPAAELLAQDDAHYADDGAHQGGPGGRALAVLRLQPDLARPAARQSGDRTGPPPRPRSVHDAGW